MLSMSNEHIYKKVDLDKYKGIILSLMWRALACLVVSWWNMG